MDLKNKNIVIGITGGIACYKVLDIIKKLRKLKADVYVIMTEHAKKLVDINEFEKASNNPVQTDLFDPNCLILILIIRIISKKTSQ